MIQTIAHQDRINKSYEKLLAEYLANDLISSFQNEKNEDILQEVITDKEKIIVATFLAKDCQCGHHCNTLFTADELLSSRAQFRSLPLSEKNCYILGQLRVFSNSSNFSISSRAKKNRSRQKFHYQINSDRPVCRYAFLFYHDETIARLKRLQESLTDTPINPPIHKNTGRQPINTYSQVERDLAKNFIEHIAEIHGLPDPGRDVRKGKGRLRILLPSIMNYTGIHRLYESSITSIGGRVVPYRTFLELWKEELPHIEFNNPRSDLCMTCEQFKKEINQITAISNEEREQKQTELYTAALNHLNHVKKERLYYKAHSKIAAVDYENLRKTNTPKTDITPNSQDIVMSYSWDFAQQLQYPFEEQQVGPIYFKTPRRAQLFGVCCEGSGRQINYLIDEAHFLEKNANTVISLLDHFFSNYGLGEMTVYLTADNCVGQNKNNALIQYLMYRVLSSLHSTIEMSFLVVGHTKFSPDSHFGFIRKQYRHSNIYTYDQLANVIDTSTQHGYNHCHRDNGLGGITYRNWSDWLSKYFKVIPNITSYHHFRMNSIDNGYVYLKKDIDTQEEKINIIKVSHDFNTRREYPSDVLRPSGLTAERQWYLYEQIRQHIPNEVDKNDTAPKPKCIRPKQK
jgi:hypothetical protein